MGLRDWWANRHKEGDELAIKRAEDEMRSGSLAERETIAGDMEGRAADARAAGRGQGWAGDNIDPRSGF
jgi:hypothetical protein